MLDQIENLRSQIKSAMREYESLFTENKPMPEHRCIDIVDLRIILDRHYDDLSSCIDAVKQRLSIIKTGWWIFKTGRSRLRHGITPILQAYDNPITQQLVTQILGISQSLNDVVEELHDSRSGKIPVLSINHQSTSDGEIYEFDDNDVRSPLFAFSVEERESAGFRIRK
jgi:hypothetical protein